MNTNQHLAQLLGMPQSDFDIYVESVNLIARLRKRTEPSIKHTEGNPASPPPSKVVGVQKSPRLASRRPMRAPKPGSLRGAVHDVLRSSAKPLRRADIIAGAAERNGCKVDENFRAKVGDLLTNPHDPLIKRVAYGTYAFADPGVMTP